MTGSISRRISQFIKKYLSQRNRKAKPKRTISVLMTVLGQQKNGHVIELGLALSLLIVSISLALFLASNRGHRCTLASVLHTHTHAHILNPVYINHLSKRARNFVVLTITAARRTRKSNPGLVTGMAHNAQFFAHHLDIISKDCEND